ncbi:MAG: GNAT family N-acetyltransferase [Firmicutes bacterium]|nr:GNAT family N-acetyltransferase [Bacillota bacterium]
MKLSPVGLQIRLMTNDDYRDVYRLSKQMNWDGACYDEFEFTRIYKKFFNSEEREAFVATVINRVIGFVTVYYFEAFHYFGKAAIIQELVVTEEFRGRGVGKALVEFVKEKTREKHCHGLEIATDMWQSGTKSFYEKCGFISNPFMLAN